MMRQIDNIIFEGGGGKGPAHAGFLLALAKYNMYNKVKRVAGSSIGSLIAFMVALGFGAEEIKEIVLSSNGINFIDFTGEYIKKFARSLLKKKFPTRENITFAELHTELVKGNTKIKDIYITGADILNQTLDIFSYETTPDMSIIKAVHISMALPFVFLPVYHRDTIYMDGGAFCNLPFLFDHERYLAPDKPLESRIKPINMRTIGVALSSAERSAWERRDYGTTKRPGLFSFPSTNMVPFSRQYKEKDDYDALRTVFLETSLNVFEIWASRDKILKEIQRTEKQSLRYLEIYCQNVVDPHHPEPKPTLRSRL